MASAAAGPDDTGSGTDALRHAPIHWAETVPQWFLPGLEDALSVAFILSCPALCFFAYKLPDKLPTVLVGVCSILVTYQLLSGDHKLFGTVGIAPIMEGIAFVVHLIDLGVWPLMIILAFAAGILGRHVRQLGVAFTGFEVGWLLSTPVYQLLSAQFAWVGSEVNRALMRQFVFVGMAVAFTCAALCHEGAEGLLLGPLMGAYLGTAGANHLLHGASASASSDCFWPATYFAQYASHECGVELCEWLLLVALGVLAQCAARRWPRAPTGEPHVGSYERLPSSSSSERRKEPRHKRAKKAMKKAAERLGRAWRAAAYFATGYYEPGPHHQRANQEPGRRRRLLAAGLAG